MAWNEWVGLAFIGVGVLFDALGCLGLLRFPDIYNRLQAGTKCVTFGTCGILLGILFHQGITTFGIKALLGIPFLLLTSPVGAHALARGAYKAGIPLWDKSVMDEYTQSESSRAE
ncbi:Na+/H+ antiporter subunit G [bacterium]|nr:Na+/H+ antiporter subunit G [bacterium]